MKPTFCVFTGSRAEYGLMRRLVSTLDLDHRCTLALIVSGSHLSAVHGNTYSEIIADGIEAGYQIKLSHSVSMAEHSAEVIQGCCRAFDALSPDVLIVLGDRYESFAAASAAYLVGIPIAHLHGGESTEGALDHALRHSITHMATWHFTAAYPYLDVVRQLGAKHQRSFCVGPMVLDSLYSDQLKTRDQFEAATGFQFGRINFLITYHSVTKSSCLGLDGFRTLLRVLEELLTRDLSVNVLFTHPNLDQGGEQIIQLINAFVDSHRSRCWSIPSLGQTIYLSALRLFSAMIGNSSSGIIEAPLLGLPVINIGDRQRGRLRFGDVIDVDSREDSIRTGLEEILLHKIAQPGFRQDICGLDHIFPRGPCPTDVIIDRLLRDFRKDCLADE